VPRVPGKGGRRPPKQAPAVKFADIWTGALPAYQLYVDYLSRLNGGWLMLGNDVAGNCVSVTWANFRRLITGVLTSVIRYPPQNEVWSFYETQNPGFNPSGTNLTNGPGSSYDNGMDIQTGLEELHQHGGPDGAKAFAFASVNVANPAECKAAIATCGGLWTGINVYDNNYTDFANDEPWDWFSESALDGGHSVLTGGYGSAPQGLTQLRGDEKFITWAEETSFTDGFWEYAVEEAWAVIWPEQLGTQAFEQGIDGAKLASAYQQVTGKKLVIP
jgi:hypothetical protein